jgi:hypothetical protein
MPTVLASLNSGGIAKSIYLTDSVLCNIKEILVVSSIIHVVVLDHQLQLDTLLYLYNTLFTFI